MNVSFCDSLSHLTASHSTRQEKFSQFRGKPDTKDQDHLVSAFVFTKQENMIGHRGHIIEARSRTLN
jgi:hypothetical protein